MTSFIIVSDSEEQIDRQIAAIVTKFSIDPFDITIVLKKADEKAAKKSETKAARSVGIEDIKQLQKKLFLKPLRGKTKAIVIKKGESLTTEAQNALLKVLEEPPIHTIIILTGKSKDAFLPTIQSRSYIIELSPQQHIPEAEREKIAALVQTIEHMTVSKALELAEELAKNKETLTNWLENIILYLHEAVVHESDISELQRKAHLLKSFQQLYREVTTTNANIRLSTESTFLLFVQ